MHVINWFSEHQRPLPWRTPETTPWEVLVSEFMLQQTQVSRVEPVFREWIQRWPTPTALSQDPLSEAIRQWGRLGYPRRARWLHTTATLIVERFNAEVPSDINQLLTFPGIGPYTARAICAFAFGIREPVVDTNTRRVLARTLNGRNRALTPNADNDAQDMLHYLPNNPQEAKIFNAAMMELGALICRAKSPLCNKCPISHECAWKKEGFPINTAPPNPAQSYLGSIRQIRGLILSALRDETNGIPIQELDSAALWQNASQRQQALNTLLQDGLISITADRYHLA